LNLSSILQKLERAQESFLSATDAISPERWATKPSREVWCAAEVTAHVALVERTVTNAANKVIQKLPKSLWFWQRVHFPLWLVEARVIRRKSPIPMDEALIGNKDRMLDQLRRTREETLAFLEITKTRDLSRYRWRHPFLGSLNVYEWIEMIAAHEIWHAKQMKEIASRLPKVVEISQNQ
jgi:hypothetical protein